MAAAPNAVVVGEERDCRGAHGDIRRRVLRRRGEDAAENNLVFVEELRVAQELGQLLVGSRIGRRAQKAQHDPAAGRDLKVEGAVADQRRAEPRCRVAQNDAFAGRSSRHDDALSWSFGCGRIVLRHGKFCSNSAV
jgi:hypothetical protein